MLEGDGLSPCLQEPHAEPPPQLYKAIEEFNSRLFWECHETLEHLWLNTPYPLRLLYHGIIKVAVGFHHLSRHNRRGSLAKLSEGVRLLRPFSPVYIGIRADLLCRDALGWLALLEGARPIDWNDLDARPTPQVSFEHAARHA